MPMHSNNLTLACMFRFYTKYMALHARIEANKKKASLIPYTARPQSNIIMPTYLKSPQFNRYASHNLNFHHSSIDIIHFKSI